MRVTGGWICEKAWDTSVSTWALRAASRDGTRWLAGMEDHPYGSEGPFAAIVVADAHGVGYVEDEHFAIADFAGPRGG